MEGQGDCSVLMMRIAGVASDLCGLSVGLQVGKLRALFGAHCCVARRDAGIRSLAYTSP